MPDKKKPPQEDGPENNYGMPENWQPVDAPPINPNLPVGGPPTPTGRDPFNSGPLPPNFGLATDLAKTDTAPGLGTVRLMPVQGGAGDNAKAIGVATTIVNQAIAGLPKQVPLTSTFVPNAIQFIDHFAFGTDNAVANAIPGGELKWNCAGSTFTLAYTSSGGFPNLGTFNFPNSSSPSSGTSTTELTFPSISQAGQAGSENALWPLFDYPVWTSTMIFQVKRYPDPAGSATASAFPLVQTSLYVGYISPSNASENVFRRPAAGAWLRFDTDTTSPSIGDSTFWFECVANDVTSGSVSNVQGNTFNTTIVPAEFTWYTLTMSSNGSGSVNFSLSGTDGSSATATLAVPTFALNSGGSGSVLVNNHVATASFAGNDGPFSTGSLVTFTGFTGTLATLNGTFPLQYVGDKDHLSWSVPTATISTVVNTSQVATGFPAVVPAFLFGNDTSASPTQNKQIAIDFFDFIWNPA